MHDSYAFNVRRSLAVPQAFFETTAWNRKYLTFLFCINNISWVLRPTTLRFSHLHHLFILVSVNRFTGIHATMKMQLPQLVRFLTIHAIIGFAFAGVFTFGLIELNAGNIGTLLANAEGYPLPTIILWFMLGLTSSSCQMGAAIMLLDETPKDGGTGGTYPSVFAPLRLARVPPSRPRQDSSPGI